MADSMPQSQIVGALNGDRAVGTLDRDTAVGTLDGCTAIVDAFGGDMTVCWGTRRP